MPDITQAGCIGDMARAQDGLIQNELKEIENLEFLMDNLKLSELGSLGYALVGLRIVHIIPESKKRAALVLEAPVEGTLLPQTTLSAGDVVEVVPPDDALAQLAAANQAVRRKNPWSGVVSSITTTRLTLSMNNMLPVPRAWDGKCSIKVLPTSIPLERMLGALTQLNHYKGRRPHLHSVLFSGAAPRFRPGAPTDELTLYDGRINAEQGLAVWRALDAYDISLVHGPPGTGKTQTLVEIIRQLVRQGQRVLVCGPSNVSVDNIAERLGQSGEVPITRVGHPARVGKGARQFTAEAKLVYPGSALDEKHRQVRKLLKQAKKAKKREDWDVANGLYAQVNMIRKEIKAETMAASRSVAKQSRVILSTLCGAGGPQVNRLDFDVVVIDEAAQALEAECWIAAIQAPKVILAGDHHQLPPTLTSPKNRLANDVTSKMMMTTTMFERVYNMLGSKVSTMLSTQYRMHDAIMRLSSEHLYDNKLVADPTVAGHLLSDLEHVQQTEETSVPLVYIDTAGGKKMTEYSEKATYVDSAALDTRMRASRSKVNYGEGKMVQKYVKRLLKAGVQAKDIAVISPYNAQVRLLRLMCRWNRGLEIGSVDGFQGGEREVVILSMVRSNDRRAVGFLNDYRRINVAITRARRHLCVIANSDTVSSGGEFLGALINYLQDMAVKRMT
ncbi:hypothetical protein GGF46_001201 [Coemansia sp. RSA 552]|nr:hypothetical protein GGF46_001201 [Coemansia sp. RSA 552]